ncbi:hypothetical protein DFJ73DRAFT_935453 [Zopfochytrium polystomum]|nr:hypothetical protein DFJ73DRAFT_935453 [Zopfochytrium polystomum]
MPCRRPNNNNAAAAAVAVVAAAAAVALLAAAPAAAFTNGTLLPEYLCAKNDGMPKTLGQVLNFAIFDKDTPLAFNADAANNMDMTDKTMTGGLPPNTAYMLASFHNTINSIAAAVNVIQVTTAATLKAGAAVPLTISSGDPNVPLVGTMIYAMDSNGHRVGTFKDTAAEPLMVPFPPCGFNDDGTPNGYVHIAELAEGGTYETLNFVAPATLKNGDVVRFMGLAVTDNGFGTHMHDCTVGQTACKAVTA